jgi:microcin C transport system substrate-binding protein
MQGFVFNLRRKRFQDARVRQALAFAFDFEWSNKVLFYGQYTRTRSYFENSELAARGLPSQPELALLEPYRGRLPEEVFRREYRPPTTDGSGHARANLRQAVELLKQAGWAIRAGKMTELATGEVLEFEVLLAQPGFERVVLPFAKKLERIGVTARVRTVDSSQYRRRADEFDFDVLVASFAQSSSPGNEQRDFWGSAAAERPGSRNLIGIRDPVVDELIELLVAAPDRESLVLRARALDRVLQWGHYLIPHWHIDADRLLYWDKFGQPEVTPKDGAQIDAWWLDPAKAPPPRAAPGRSLVTRGLCAP